MAEYIVRTDKPIRLDEVLHLHGVHNFEVARLRPHGDLCDKDELMNEVDSTYMWEQAVRKVRLAPVIVEASDGIDN